MGMDVYGLKPKNPKGEYFRNNVWWWHPLWDYCCQTCPEITLRVTNGHDNSGDGLGFASSRKLGLRIQQSIKDGSAKDYVDRYNLSLKTLPDEPCFCLKKSIFEIFSTTPFEALFPQTVATQGEQGATGPQGTAGPESSQANVNPEGANGPQGTTQVQATSESQGPTGLEDNIEFQISHLSENKSADSKCPTCKGSGMQPNWNANYHIDVDNIQNFAEFLVNCGGFQIC